MKCPNCLSSEGLRTLEETLTDNNVPKRIRVCDDCRQVVYTYESIDYNRTKLQKLKHLK